MLLLSELLKVKASPIYKAVEDKYRNEKIMQIILGYVATAISSEFRIIERSNSFIDGQIIDIVPDIIIEEMLNYLDIYPIMLPARYNDKVACFTKVYITSNLPINRQYVAIQEHKPKTFQAFLRRINYIEHFKADGIVEKTTLNKEVKLNE